jgi:peptidoglycan/LPS O-acetylase OafA/YrhL
VLIVTRLPLDAAWRFGLAALVYPAAFAYCVFYLAFSPQLVNAARYGDFSYGTYLFAFPIQQMIRASFGTQIPFWIYVPLTICLSVAAGVASWYCVERWFLTRNRLPEADLQESKPDVVASGLTGNLHHEAGIGATKQMSESVE